MKIQIITSYFQNVGKACFYYAPYYENDMVLTSREVGMKIRDGAIVIGKPLIKPGERLSINSEGRYVITTD